MAIRILQSSNSTLLLTCSTFWLITTTAFAADNPPNPVCLEPTFVHLRNGVEREWSDFPESGYEARLEKSFHAVANTQEQTLVIRQQDVRQTWNVVLNGKRLGELVQDENDQMIALPIPPGMLKTGDNVLAIEAAARKAPVDDIRVGSIFLHQQPRAELLSQAHLDVTVIDADSSLALPCRLTIVHADGALQPLGVSSNQELAVRTGTVFTSAGRARIALPAGSYTIFAGRGFEYSLATATVELRQGQTVRQLLSIRREVPTGGYVACDTHVHTLTHSRHGDATVAERLITLAAEGLELPIATDHNVHVNCDADAQRLGVRPYFTPVIGNEVTTSRGHFNIFPIQPGAPVPDHTHADWDVLFNNIYRTPGVKIAILNHARDLHSGVRPFGPAVYNSVVAENLEGWPLRFNAMEVVNSGAVQTDILRLFRDWMGLLNRGLRVTPVGSSDSHDVVRYFNGQGRTYLRCDDRDPGHLDVAAAVDNFIQGQVIVSYGLMTELTVNQKYASGEMATAPDDTLQVDVRVLAPHWITADRILLFSNGQVLKDEPIPDQNKPLPVGVKYSATWQIPRPHHDVHLVAIALGPGVDGLYWKTARPYQPTSPEFHPHVVGCSGTVWVDADQDGRFSSARDYAEQLVEDKELPAEKLVERVANFDQAVSEHVSYLMQRRGPSQRFTSFEHAVKSAPAVVQEGFKSYMQAWRENEIARSSQ